MIQSKVIKQICSDLKTVNSARVSMAVTHDTYEPKADTGLINYLAKHAHWTPFAHNRDIIFLPVSEQISYYHIIEYFTVALSPEEQASMVIQNNLYHEGARYIAVKTSLYGWAQIIKNLDSTYYKNDPDIIPRILSVLMNKYPNSINALLGDDFISQYKIDNNLTLKNHTLHNALLNSLQPKMFDITIYEMVPIFVARQRFKHVIMTVYNELSRRYVDSTPTIYYPEAWRPRPDKSIKQGSGEGPHERSDVLMEQYDNFCKVALDFYNKLVNIDKVAPEMARMVLPQSMMTEYYVTSNVTAWDRFIAQRKDGHAQKEIQLLADSIEAQLDDTKQQLNSVLSYPSNVDRVAEMHKLGVF